MMEIGLSELRDHPRKVDPNLITGEVRTRVRGSNKKSDLKKKTRRKIAKKSRRQSRR